MHQQLLHLHNYQTLCAVCAIMNVAYAMDLSLQTVKAARMPSKQQLQVARTSASVSLLAQTHLATAINSASPVILSAMAVKAQQTEIAYPAWDPM